MTEIQKELEQAYGLLATIPVCADAVDAMAAVRGHLRTIYQMENRREGEAEVKTGEAAAAAVQ